MRAVEYYRSLPRYTAQQVLSKRALATRLRLAPLRLTDLKPPTLPTPHWVRVAPRLTGVCGSDLATILGTGSPYLAPVTSLPFVLGHELVGEVLETGDQVTRVSVGDRVVLQPALGCVVRGIEPLCPACAAGQNALCRNVARGQLAPGIQTGYCRDTGGGWSDAFIAHESQLYPVPAGVDDRAAVLLEPFACAVHALLQVTTKPSDIVLVIGCGTIGLLLIAGLRAIGCTARIVAVARFPHQQEHARRLGADAILTPGGKLHDRYAAWAETLNADVLPPVLGKPNVLGGADVTFDCVGSTTTLDDAIRFTTSGGSLVMVGMPGSLAGVDGTPMWFKELCVQASYAYGTEQTPQGPRTTFDVALDLLPDQAQRLAPLTSTPYPLEDYREAVRSALDGGPTGAIKTVLAVQA